MRMSTAISQLENLITKAEEWANSNTAYYETSLNQFARIGSLAQRLSDIVNNIDHVRRCPDADTCKVEERLDGMESKMDAMNAQMSAQMNAILAILQGGAVVKSNEGTPGAITITTAPAANPDPAKESESEADVISDNPEAEQQKAPEKELLTDVKVPQAVDEETDLVISLSKSPNQEAIRKNAKTASREYYRTLRKLAEYPHKYKELQELSKLLFDWYDRRFYRNYQYRSSFKYSYTYVRKLIYLITIAYGHHLHEHTTDNFVKDFYVFLDKLGVDQKVTDQYAVPFEIFQLVKEYDQSYDNAEAITMYEELYDCGLNKLSAEGGCSEELIRKYRLSYDRVYEMVLGHHEYGSNISKNYSAFSEDFSLFMRGVD